MPISGQNYYYSQFGNAIPFRERKTNGAQILTKPIDKVENFVNNTVDTFVPENAANEEQKKSHKTAVRVASSVAVLSLVVAALNPKFSSKLIDKLKTASAKYGAKAQNSNTYSAKLYRGGEKFLSESAKFLNFTNNYNSVKDEAFKWLCNKTKFLKKPHELITKWFDSISKHTVFAKYANAKSGMDNFEKAINVYKNKLSKPEQANLEKLLAQVKSHEEYFTKESISKRLKAQETVMSDLESDTIKKIKSYGHGFKNGNRVKHVKDNMYFWAEDIIMPKRNQVEAEGLKVVHSLVGDGKTQKGTYNEIVELISPHLKSEEKTLLDEILQKTTVKLNNAHKSECVEYFDKKRDLILGSAPTDVLTAIIGLGASGVAIGTADTKEDKTSRAVTVAFPAIAGLGVSMGMTAMLYSGIKGMLIGLAASGALSLTGSAIDKTFIRSGKPKEGEVHNA